MPTLRERLETEDTVENHLIKQVKAARGLNIKLRFMRGWPDRLVLLPEGVLVFFELKRPFGGVFEPLQLRIHMKLRRMGFRVFVCSTKRQVNEAMEQMQ